MTDDQDLLQTNPNDSTKKEKNAEQKEEIKIEEEVLIVPDESSLEPEQNPRISQMPIQNQQKESDPRISSEKSDVTEKTRFVTARET